MSMTTEEMRVAIAEKCGWKICANGMMLYNPNQKSGVLQFAFDPLTDLNAMHEAEVACIIGFITPCGQYATHVFQDYLKSIVEKNVWVGHATAAQRAEAFLRTLNLYKETPL